MSSPFPGIAEQQNSESSPPALLSGHFEEGQNKYDEKEVTPTEQNQVDNLAASSKESWQGSPDQHEVSTESWREEAPYDHQQATSELLKPLLSAPTDHHEAYNNHHNLMTSQHDVAAYRDYRPHIIQEGAHYNLYNTPSTLGFQYPSTNFVNHQGQLHQRVPVALPSQHISNQHHSGEYARFHTPYNYNHHRQIPNTWKQPEHFQGTQVNQISAMQETSPPSGAADSTVGGKGRKKERTSFSKEQVDQLEEDFLRNNYLTRLRRYELAVKLDLTERQIKVWFQNRRMKWKRQSTIAPSRGQNNSNVSSPSTSDSGIMNVMNTLEQTSKVEGVKTLSTEPWNRTWAEEGRALKNHIIYASPSSTLQSYMENRPTGRFSVTDSIGSIKTTASVNYINSKHASHELSISSQKTYSTMTTLQPLDSSNVQHASAPPYIASANSNLKT